MRNMLIAAAAALAFTAAPSFAQDAPSAEEQLAKLNAASDLVETLNLRQMMTQLTNGTTTALVTAVAQTGEVNDETRAAVRDAVRSNLAARLPDIIPLIAPVTADAFTMEELDAMNAFYESDVGKSIIAKLPGYQAASSRLMATWMQQNTNPIQIAIIEELKGKGIEVPTQRTTAPQAR